MSKLMMTEEDVRDAWMTTQRESLDEWRRQMRAEGQPPEVIELLAEITMAQSVANLERALPLIMRDLAITGGVASSH